MRDAGGYAEASRSPERPELSGRDWDSRASRSEFGPADWRDNRQRGLQGNYGETGRHFGFDRSSGDPRGYGEPSRYPRQAGEQGMTRGMYPGGPRGGEEESWGQQLRGAGQQVARTVKRAFRGPKGYKRSDERIREDVSDRFAQQDELDPSDIEISVSDGEVTLSGTVNSRHEKFQAEEIADSVQGVNDVHNRLRVRREQGRVTSADTVTFGSDARNRNARA